MSLKSQTCLVLGFIATLAFGTARADLLTNGNFEMPVTEGENFCTDGNFSVPGWGCFNDALIVGPDAFFGAPVSHDEGGSQALKLFGFDGGAIQSVAVTEGSTYEASVWAMNYAQDPFNHVALLALSFLDADGNVLGDFLTSLVGQFEDGDSFQPLDPQDGQQVSDWTRLSVMGIAPEGTTTANFLLLHIFDQSDTNPASAIYFDDASLVRVSEPASLWLLAAGLIALVRVRGRKASR